MTESEYLEERLEDQINWYDKKSITNKSSYRICQVIQILFAALITLSAAFPKDLPLFLIPTFGAIIALASSFLALYKFQENWIAYRTTSETLKHEKYLFVTKSSPYQKENRFTLFVNRVESLISKENSNWSTYMSKDDT